MPSPDEFNDLLLSEKIDPAQVLALRHVPQEPTLKQALPQLAVARPDLHNAYQRTQPERVERCFEGLIKRAAEMGKPAYIASFYWQ
jgi:hypothetical protein